MDRGRQHDMYFLERKLADPKTSERDRKKIQDAQHALRDQAQFASVRKLREAYDTAMRQGDKAKIERLTRDMQRIDRNYQ